MSKNFYDRMVAAVSRLLSVGSILASPVVVKDVVYVGKYRRQSVRSPLG